MKKLTKISKYLIYISIILICSITFVGKIFENDLFFDIKTGQDILKYGIDFKDHFSFIPNLIYIYHHWLYNLIIYGIYKILGYNGIFAFFLMVFSIFGLIVFYINNKRVNTFPAFLISIFTLYVSSVGFGSRVQSITYVLFFLEVYLLEELYKTGEKKYSILLIINSIIIANLHMPIWIFYLILCLPYMVETILYLISQRNKKLGELLGLEKPNNSKIMLITFTILLFTGLISPLKFNAYTFFTKSLFNIKYQLINEMEKTSLYYFKSEIIIILIVLVGEYLKIIKFKFRDFLLIVGLFLFTLIAKRNVEYFLIITPTIFIKSLIVKTNIKGNRIKKILKKININIVAPFAAVTFIALYIFIDYSFFNIKNDYGITDSYPDKIVNYIKENIDYKNVKIYNDFNYGSFMALNEIPVFIDSRAEVYMKEFNGGEDIIIDYADSKMFSTYKEVFDKYNFDYALVYSASELYSYLKNDKDYKIIKEEDDVEKYALFEKRIEKKHE